MFYPRNFPVDMIYKPHPDSYLQVMSECVGKTGAHGAGGRSRRGGHTNKFFFKINL